MGSNGGCGCGAAGAEPCRCERPVAPPDGVPPANGPPAANGAAAPPRRGPVAAPGTPQPYTRFDLFEEARRRGLPVAFPQDPARPPPPLRPADAQRMRTADQAGPGLIEPPLHPDAGGRPPLEPRFAPSGPHLPAGLPLAPDGAQLDMERFLDVASPEGVAMPFDLAWPGELAQRMADGRMAGLAAGVPADLARARALRDPLQPPEYLSLVGGPAERHLFEASPVEEPPPRERPEPPGPPGFASPQEPRDGDPRAPGQDECAKEAHYVFPEAEQFLFTPQQPEAGGGGGGEEPEPGMNVVAGGWVDPCPCICFCIHFSDILNVFVVAARLVGSFFDLFGKDSGLMGVSGDPAVVLATPDGFVEQVRDAVARRDTVSYGAPSPSAPGAAAPLDGLSATLSLRAPQPPAAPPRLLWPELDGTLSGEVRAIAPVGPGPGLPGIGKEPLAPASGSPLRAAPGSLPAGVAPAGDGFEPDARGRIAA